MRREQRTVWVSEDGVPFFDKEACEEYSAKREREQARNEILHILESRGLLEPSAKREREQARAGLLDLHNPAVIDALLDWRDLYGDTNER